MPAGRSHLGCRGVGFRRLAALVVALTIAPAGALPAAAQVATPAGAAAYTDPAVGWSIAWDPARWQTATPIPRPGETALTLFRPPEQGPGQGSYVFFVPLEAYGGDPDACIDDAPDLIDGWWPSRPGYDVFAEEAAPLRDEAGTPIVGETADAAHAAYVLDREGDGPDESDTVEALSCRTLVPGRSVLLIRYNPVQAAADPAAYAAAASALDELLEGMTVPDAAPAPTTIYRDEKYGFSVTYDAGVWWDRSGEARSRSLRLTDGVGYLQIAGNADLPTDAVGCVEELAAGLASTSSRRGYRPMEDGAGEPVGGGDASAAFAVSVWDGRVEPIFEYLGCYALPNGQGVVTVVHSGPLARYDPQMARLETLLAGLALEPDRS